MLIKLTRKSLAEKFYMTVIFLFAYIQSRKWGGNRASCYEDILSLDHFSIYSSTCNDIIMR